MAEALARPGIDTRTWTTVARVTETSWDPALGWMVTVIAYGPGLEGVELNCRQASALAGIDAGEYLPMTVGAEVVVSLPGASTDDDMPLVMAGVTNEEDKAPIEINGLPINGEAPASSALVVSPLDTEIKVSAFGRREQYAKELTTQAAAITHTAATITQAADAIRLGSKDAAKSFVLGEELVSRLVQTVDALLTLLGTGANPGGPVAFAGLPAFNTFWTTPQTGMKAQLQSALVLSEKVKGE